MINYWNGLSERERWMLGIASLCSLLYLFYLLLYSPLANAVHDKAKQLLEKQETLAWMQQIKEQPKNDKKQQSVTNTKLLTLIGNELDTGSLRHFTYQLQQTVSGDIQLSYELVPFNPFLSWLWNLSNRYLIELKQISAEKSPSAGLVKLQVIIAAKM